LQANYPEHTEIWQVHRQRGYWKQIEHQRSFFEKMATKLNIQKPEDWLNVSKVTAAKEGGHFIHSIYNGSLLKGK
jgi:hypothetical protein